MESIYNINWGEFEIEQIFSVKSGKRLTKSAMNKGDKPFIGATDSNNGITAFISNSNTSEDSNVLGVNYNGSVVENFYHPYTAIFSDDVKRLSFKDVEGNKYLFLFVKTQILKQKGKYQYGYKFNGKRMNNQKILLPIVSEGKPDYAFMEQYVKAKEQEQLEQYYKYIEKRLHKLKKCKKVEPLTEKTWGEFYLKQIFDFLKGDQNHMSELTSGGIPLISARNGENGLKGFVSINNKKLYKKNTLTINNDGDGGAGISYYQPFDYLLDSHVTSLAPRLELSKQIMAFISRCLTKQRDRFGHGYSLNNRRLGSFKLMLPINTKGEPDYDYMGNYMTQMEYLKLKQYLKYKKAEG